MILSLRKNSKLFKLLIVLAVLAILLFLLYKFFFLRIPERNIPGDNSLFISPANGKVIAVEPWFEDSLSIVKKGNDVLRLYTGDLGESGTIVSIRLNLLNVHYQRAPVGGRFMGNHYKEGRFQYALTNEGKYGFRMENEANVLYFETATGIPYRVIQIAGIAARRISHFPSDEDWVDQGELIGLISMGSQVAVIFNEQVDIAVKPGDILIDGETVIASQRLIGESIIP